MFAFGVLENILRLAHLVLSLATEQDQQVRGTLIIAIDLYAVNTNSEDGRARNRNFLQVPELRNGAKQVVQIKAADLLCQRLV